MALPPLLEEVATVLAALPLFFLFQVQHLVTQPLDHRIQCLTVVQRDFVLPFHSVRPLFIHIGLYAHPNTVLNYKNSAFD